MKLTILNVAYPLAPVGPDAVGGAEQVVWQLDTALTRAGHKSLVVACQGSLTQGELIATPASRAEIDPTTRSVAAANHRSAIAHVLRYWDVDVVHLHGVDFPDYLPEPGVPVLVTLHLPPHFYDAAAFRIGRPQTFFNCVSKTQAKAFSQAFDAKVDRSRGDNSPILLSEIGNGVTAVANRHARRGYALSLGRICPEKGYHLALQACLEAGVPWLLCGQVFPYRDHQVYFQQEIRPRLDKSRRFIGPVGLQRKRRLLSGAMCLVVPSLVPETSSLVAMEALACGTPVVAFRAGALEEIVEDGRTGFLVSDQHAMARAIRTAHSLQPDQCRLAAQTRFSLGEMIDKYFEVYRRLADSKRTADNIKEGHGAA